MDAIFQFFALIGPLGYLLIPLSIITSACVLYAVILIIKGTENLEACEALSQFFSCIREAAVLLGIMGTIIAIAGSFKIEGVSPEEIRTRLFSLIGHGFWCTFLGVWIALQGVLGLALIKKL
ncbi:MAG: hypothetical protein Q7J31_04445 [Syntrophales bacterium]|nr:hypothetical protein [Syntrophales bacterium]